MKKYKFNPKTLNYEQVKIPLKYRLYLLTIRIVPGIIIGTLLFFSVFKYFVFPDETRLLEIQQRKIEKYFKLNTQLNFATEDVAEFLNNDNELYRPMIGMEILPQNIREAGVGGVERYKYLRGYENTNVMIRSSSHLDFIISQLLIQSQSYSVVVEEIEEQKRRKVCLPSIRPVKLEKITAIGTFGMRVHPILRIYRMHKGVDLCAPKNTEIYASADGKVIENTYHHSLGNFIKIKHGYGYITVYGHLEKSFVKYGQRVKKGEKIALMGSTGISNVDHLHYEVYKNYRAVNPFNYYYDELTDREYKSLISNNTEAEGFHVR